MLAPIFHLDPRSVADAGDELSIQKRLQKALRERLNVRFVSIPNGAQRTAWAAMIAKQEGLAKGFPDGLVLWPGDLAFVELKTKQGDLSEHQHIWCNWLHNAGFRVGCFRSVDSCIAWLIEQGAPVRAQAVAA